MTVLTAKMPPLVEEADDPENALEAMENPYPRFGELQHLGPVVAIKRRGLINYHVTGYSNAVAVLNDSRFSKDQARMAEAISASGKSGPEAGFVLSGSARRNLLNTDAPDHTRLRKLVSQAFQPARIKALEADIERQIRTQLDALSGREEADLIADYAYPIAINLICIILGVPPQDKESFRIWATAASTPHIIAEAPVTQAEGARLLNEYLAELIQQVRVRISEGETSDDLLTAMALAQEETDALTDDELQAMAFLLLVAGHETTVGLIGATLLRLGNEPEQRQMLVDDPSLIDVAIEEFLRLDGPVMRTTFRVAVEDVEIEGYLIPRGGITTVALPTANRDPVRYEDPDRFDVTRTGKPNLAFGFGPHFCLGRSLARSETKLAVNGFLQKFPDYEPGKAVWAKTVVRAPRSLPARLGRDTGK
ncbi:MAG: cytochrome P450 [Sphingomonadales bacterium]|nr:cytochrome P450 [Sphingomonadaceae bacterium]MBS3932536.1 cytochrome P450 [Sphingomonadales bacterium]